VVRPSNCSRESPGEHPGDRNCVERADEAPRTKRHGRSATDEAPRRRLRANTVPTRICWLGVYPACDGRDCLVLSWGMRIFSTCLVIVLAGSQAQAAVENVEVARQHYETAVQFYDLGRFEDAIREFESAYAAKQDPAFLYNLAQSFRRLGDSKRALELYKNFLLRMPETPKRAEVERRIESLQELVDQAAARNATAPQSVPAATTSVVSPGPAANTAEKAEMPRTLRIAGLATAGAGILGIVGGVVFGLRARSLGNQVSNAPVFVSSDDEAGKESEVLQWVCYGVSAAALATGAVLFYLGRPDTKPARVAVAPVLWPQGAGLVTGGTF
jgi:tetratricopeptide (TPR) repeat protein